MVKINWVLENVGFLLLLAVVVLTPTTPKETISERREIILSFNRNSRVIYYSKYLPKNVKRKTFRLSGFPTLTQLVKYGSIIKDLCIQIDWSQRTTELMEIEALLFLTSLE